MLPESLFSPKGKLVDRTVELADGTKHTFWFRILPNSAFELYAIHRASDDEEVVAMAPTRLLSKGLCDPDGKQALTMEQADDLKRPVLLRLVSELLDVNGYSTPRAAKEPPGPNHLPPEPTSGSGTLSH